MKSKTDKEGNSHEEEDEIFGARMDFVAGIKSYVSCDEYRHRN